MGGKKGFSILLMVTVLIFLMGGIALSAPRVDEMDIRFPIDVSGFSTEDLAELEIIVNGEKIESDVDPVIRDGRLLIPLRAVFNALGAEVHWFEDPRTVAIMDRDQDIRIIVQLENYKGFGNRKHVQFEQEPILHGDRTMVLPELIVLGYAVDVEWDKDGRQLIIDTR